MQPLSYIMKKNVVQIHSISNNPLLTNKGNVTDYNKVSTIKAIVTHNAQAKSFADRMRLLIHEPLTDPSTPLSINDEREFLKIMTKDEIEEIVEIKQRKSTLMIQKEDLESASKEYQEENKIAFIPTKEQHNSYLIDTLSEKEIYMQFITAPNSSQWFLSNPEYIKQTQILDSLASKYQKSPTCTSTSIISEKNSGTRFR
jgi:hypothetical protein